MSGCGCLRAEGENRPSRPGHIAVQSTICFQAYGDRDNPNISVSDKAYCLPANPMSDRGQAICFQQNQREEVRSLGEQTGAIAANAGAHQTNYICESVDLIRESRGAFETYEQGAIQAGSLKQCDNKGSQVVCYAVRTRNTMANGWGVAENAYTLDTSEGQAVAYSVDCRNMNLTNEHGTLQAKENGGQSLNYMGAVCYPIDSHQQDSRFKICEDGVCPTVPGQMGTGGNNGPMVLEAYSAGNGQLHQALEHEKARPLDCMHDQQIVLHPSKPPRRYIIRRLTPLERCRLQGFPDWWEDGVQGSDSARYKMWGNGIALPNAAYVIGCARKLIQGEHHRQGPEPGGEGGNETAVET
jgi:hypothetical protein